MSELLAEKADALKDLELGREFYCSIAFKAASDLRNALHIDEQAFRQIAPSLWKDPRQSFIYRVLDEVQKAGICIHEWVEKLKDDKEKSKPFDHLDRLARQWLSDEQSFRARKLAEVLVELICFSTTNETEYYRDYLRLRDLEAVSRSLNDQEEFFGFRRRNSEYHADWIERDILAAEEAGLDVSKRWYLKDPVAFQAKWRTRGVRFSSFRQRYIRSLGLALPTEIAALGKSYVHAYGMSAEIHFTAQEISSDFDPKDVYLGIDRVGLLCFAIVIRCQLLLGVIPEGLNAELRKMHDGNAKPAEILSQLKTEKAKVGDFVWANGDICEVVAVTKSKYGYVSYLLRYVERPPIPEIKEDWFAAFEVRLVATRSFAEEALWNLQTDPATDEKTKARFRDMKDADRNALMAQAVAKLWRLWQQAKTSQPRPSQASDKSKN